MAYILLVDPDEVAKKAMKGILVRGSHRVVTVDTASEAWDFLRRNVKVDLVLVELELKGDNGVAFIQRLKSDCCLKLLPVVVYTAHGDRESVKRILALHAQNFLIKPYHDDAVFAEIAKAVANPWRQQHFEEEKSFCKMTGLTPEGLHKTLESLRTELVVARTPLQKWAELQAVQSAIDELAILSAKAEEAGAWGVVECLKILNDTAQAGNWAEFGQNLEMLAFASQLIFRHLNPSLVPDDFLSSQEVNAETEAQARAVWANAAAENRCPVVSWEQLQREIEALAGCPVIDSTIASFKMTANGHPTSLNPLMDLVDKDPGLTAQMLIASNQLKRRGKEDGLYVEDPRMAVGLLGEIRLAAQGRALVAAEERMMLAPPLSSWPHFWMFQMGTARIARFTCRYLERVDLEAQAYTAGLMHDLGKLLLLRLHPFAFQTILNYARQRQVTLVTAEGHFLGATTHEMAAHFADKHGLPPRFANVMRWIDSPQDATEDAELVAIVSLSRELCRHNHVGFSGDSPKDRAVPLQETAEWQILRGSVFPSFDLKKFESQVQAECRQLKHELHGRLSSYAMA
jgi:CheY-like chemotaxis protein/HD-like signal output (HDOD) protein